MISRELSRPLYEPLHRDLDRVRTEEGGGGVDPLAGISFIGRWEPSLWQLFQDFEMTIPVLLEGDPVGAMHDPVSGLTFDQDQNSLRPTASLVNGHLVPYFDNGDQHLKLEGIEALIPTMGELALWFRLDDDTGYQIVSTVDDAYDRFSDNAFQYPGLFITPRINTYRGSMPTAGEHALTCKATATTYENWLDGVSGGSVAATYGFSRSFVRLGGGGTPAGAMTGPVGSVYLNDAWTTEERERIEDHQWSLFTP